MLSRTTRYAAAAVVIAVAPGTLAQNFNIDFEILTGTPTSTYGAAGAQPGVWTNPVIAGVVTPIPLNDTTGAATGVTLQCAGPVFSFTTNNALTTGDDEALMDDLLDLSNLFGVPINFVFTGLQAGTYDVYAYAWAPDDPINFITAINVNGQPDENVGGAIWPGSHVEGVTYATQSTTIAAGQTLTVAATPIAGFGSLNGIQIKKGGCYADCNGIGGLTIADFGCFQTRFVAQDPYADCNNVGGLTIADFGCFQTKFVQGCTP